MQFPFLHVIFVLLAFMTVLAGCSGSPASPAPGTSGQAVTMSQLLLSPSEMPFVVMDERTKNPDLMQPEFMQFGAIQGLSRTSLSEKTVSATSVQLVQTLVEYPPGKAALAFEWFVDMTGNNPDQSRYRITWLPEPGIGEKSSALIIADLTGAESPRAMIVFYKSNIMESLVMSAPSNDIAALTRAARAAAAKIPS